MSVGPVVIASRFIHNANYPNFLSVCFFLDQSFEEFVNLVFSKNKLFPFLVISIEFSVLLSVFDLYCFHFTFLQLNLLFLFYFFKSS